MSANYSYHLDIRNTSTGAPAIGLASVELRSGVISYAFSEVGNGVYFRASIPAGRYDLYVNGVSSAQSYGVGEGELAGLGYSADKILGSDADKLAWKNKPVYVDVSHLTDPNAHNALFDGLDAKYSAIGHQHTISNIQGLTEELANKVDKVTTALQTMLGSLKLPFVNFLSTLTGVLPTGATEGATWYNGVLKRLTVFNGTDNKQLAFTDDVRNQAGMVTMPTITVTGFNITVGDNGVVRAYDNANWAGIAKDYSPTGGTFALNQNADNLLIYTAGVGYSIGATSNDWNLSNKVVVTRFFVGMGRVHKALENNLLAIGQCEQVVVKEALTTFYERVGNIGLGLTVTGLVPEISAAEVYSGPTREQIAQFTIATGTLYQAQVTGTTWTETAISAINTTIYNPSTGVAELPPSKWAWAYIYRTIGNDIEAYVRYGEEYFSTDTAALKGFKLPSTLDIVLAKHSMLVGYVLFQKGNTSIPVDRVFTPWDITLSSSGVSLHESLPDLQGGVLGEHVHLTIDEKAIVTTASTTFAPRETTLSDEVASTTLPSTGLATLVGLLQTVRNCLNYLVTNALDKSLTTEQTMAGRLAVNSASIPLQSSRNTSETVGDWNSLALLHQSTETTLAGFAVSMAVDLKDATTTAQKTLGQIRWKRIVSGDLDTAVNRQVNVEFWGFNGAGNYVRQAFIAPNGLMYGNANPDASDDSYAFATTAWASPRPSVIGNNGTLPSGMPVGKRVLLESSTVFPNTVKIPSGEFVRYVGTNVDNTWSIGNIYTGAWFEKTTSNIWRVHNN